MRKCSELGGEDKRVCGKEGKERAFSTKWQHRLETASLHGCVDLERVMHASAFCHFRLVFSFFSFLAINRMPFPMSGAQFPVF